MLARGLPQNKACWAGHCPEQNQAVARQACSAKQQQQQMQLCMNRRADRGAAEQGLLCGAAGHLQPGDSLLLSDGQVDMWRNAMRLGLGQQGSISSTEPLEEPVNVGAAESGQLSPLHEANTHADEP